MVGLVSRDVIRRPTCRELRSAIFDRREVDDGFEEGGDVRRVSGLTCRVLRRFEMRLGHRDCYTVSTSKIKCFILKSKL